jgi:hypothetical protein
MSSVRRGTPFLPLQGLVLLRIPGAIMAGAVRLALHGAGIRGSMHAAAYRPVSVPTQLNHQMGVAAMRSRKKSVGASGEPSEVHKPELAEAREQGRPGSLGPRRSLSVVAGERNHLDLLLSAATPDLPMGCKGQILGLQPTRPGYREGGRIGSNPRSATSVVCRALCPGSDCLAALSRQ